MRSNQNKKKIIISLLVLALAFAAVAAGASVIERNKQKKQNEDTAQAAQAEKSAKEEKLDELEDSEWGGDNTLYIDDELYGYDHRIETFLFIGTDHSGNPDATGEEEYHGAMADFLLLMVIDHTDDKYGFLQIDRNTMAEIPMITPDGETADYQTMQLCTSHWYGKDAQQSAENTVDVVSELVGELDPINGYYVLSMDQIGTLNASVGGVDVTIEEDMTAVDPAFTKGTTLTLTDEQAEKFIRARMALEDDSNQSRMSRQKQYMNSFFSKALAKFREEPNFINTLWDTLINTAVTDMSGNSFSRIAETMRKDESRGFLTFEGETKLGTTLDDGEEHDEFYPDTDSVRDVLTELFTLQHIEEEEE